jgi:hypothetical protein
MHGIMENINNYFKYGNFFAIKELFSDLSLQERHLKLVTLAAKSDSIAIYTGACFFILGTQTAETHHAASVIMAAVLVYYNGAYSSGLLHARCMIEYDPNDYTNYEWLLFFYAIPDNLVACREAYDCAQKILTIQEGNSLALKTKKEVEYRWLNNMPEPIQYVPQDDEYPEFVELMHTGFYQQAKALMDIYSWDEQKKILYILMERHQSVAFYTYAFFMLLDQEAGRGHLLAGELLMQLKEVTGVQSGALFHARRAVELEPQVVTYLEFLLSFYALSEPLLTDEEAVACAQKILIFNPDHAYAKQVIILIK